MYSSVELIQKSAARNILNKLITETLSDIPQKVITIENTYDIDLLKILSQLSDEEYLITNDNYIEEACDYQVLNNKGKILISINDDGSIINNFSQQEYLDNSICDQLATIYNILRKSNIIYTITSST